MNFLFRLLLTFNATSLIIVIYLVKERIILNSTHYYLSQLPHFISYLIYLFIPVLLTFLSIIISKGLDRDSLEYMNESSAIREIEQANNAFLPSYLGYFFVALSVPYCDTLIFIFGLLFVFTFLSQTLYFNPLFLLFNYHFYYLTTNNNRKIFLITRKELKNPENLSFPELRRINNFTFIDIRK